MELSIRWKRLSFYMTFLSKLYCLERRVWQWPSSSALKKGGGKSLIIHIVFLRRVSVLAMASPSLLVSYVISKCMESCKSSRGGSPFLLDS